jgi:hypothetical protein
MNLRYYYEPYEPPGACPPDAICPLVSNLSKPSFQNLEFKNASYKQSFVKNAPSTLSYYVSYTWWFPSVRRIYSGHQLLFGSNICRRAHGIRFPYTFTKVCPDNASGCPLGFVICGTYPSNYLQCVTFRVSWGGYYACLFPRCFNSNSYPLCRN